MSVHRCTTLSVLSACSLALLATSQTRVTLADEGGKPAPFRWNEAEFVFIGKLDKVVAGPVAQSFPPIYNHTLTFTVQRVLRGQFKQGETVTGFHSARQEREPVFPRDRVVIVAGTNSRNGLAIQRLEEADDKAVKNVELLTRLPLGWTNDDGKFLSPWESLGKAAWPADAQPKTDLVCAKSGRPALLCGPGVSLEVEAVPPKEIFEFKNPDGDGQYKITVTNTTKNPLTIPALLTNGKAILWENSLLVLSQGKVYRLPQEQELTADVRSTTLNPSESVSTIVNVLKLQGPEWPRGGSRIEFMFCLGELSRTKSLYYFSNHHDPLREAA